MTDLLKALREAALHPTKTLTIEENNSINPINYSTIPLPHIILNSGPDDKIDHVYRVRNRVRFADLEALYPKGTFNEDIRQKMIGEDKTDILEIVCRDYSVKNEEAYLFYAICMTPEEIEAQRKSFARAEMGFGSDADEAAYRAALDANGTEELARLDAEAEERMKRR